MLYCQCILGCGWSNYSNVFRKIMTSLPVTKKPPISASVAEVATNFKMLQFTCTGTFRQHRTHFEGIITEKKYPAAKLRACASVRYNALVLSHKIMYEA